MHNGPRDHEPHQKVGRQSEMATFDRLSPRLRDVLNYAVLSFSAVEMQSMMLDDGDTEDEVIDGLRAAEERARMVGQSENLTEERVA